MPTPVSLSRRAHTTAVALRSFYGWRIAGFAAVTLAMKAPGQTVGVSVFVDPMMPISACPDRRSRSHTSSAR